MLWREEGNENKAVMVGGGHPRLLYRWAGQGGPLEGVTNLKTNRWEGAGQDEPDERWGSGGGNVGKGFGAAQEFARLAG